MLFNSIDFAIFLPIIFFLYWFVFNNNLRLQNLLIVIASYVFYGWWDWRFLSLIFFSTIVDYLIGLKLNIESAKTKRKLLLWTSIFVNIGLLGIFKYYNFFLENFIDFFSFFGKKIDAKSLNIILPVGISFYTFQTLSYTIDVYKGKLKATTDFISFASFVSFFPQLVAGPIERAKNLLPQFHKKRVFKYDSASDGVRQILWGLFKKVVVADNAAIIVNDIFDNYNDYSGSTLFFGAVFFAFQIYGDFSGYSDIAIGTAKLFGFNLMQNFNFPYFSRDIAEFWRRWHISLSTWFRDYLYIPLGGSRVNLRNNIRNVFIIFLVSGFWHGANWTFIVWGGLNALYFMPLLLLKINRINTNTVARENILPSLKEFLQILSTFLLTTLAWVFFRASNIKNAINYLSIIFSKSFFEFPYFSQMKLARNTALIIIVFIFIEWLGRNNLYAIENIVKINNIFLRYTLYFIIISAIMIMGNFNENQFIYFQF